MATQRIEPGDWITGSFWKTPVQVVSIQKHSEHGYDLVSIYSADKQPARSYVLTSSDWERVERVTQADRTHISFDGDPVRFRLGIEALRLRLAHSVDSYAALNASRIDPLPHQFEAVYEHLLSRPLVRAMLAHDAGAGKTVMAGMLIKELKRRQGVQRVLIVAPAGLTEQWKRELLTKFGENFVIISRDYMNQERLDSLEVWRDTELAITSIDFARQKAMQQALETVEWDLVIVDEAHKMAAYLAPNGYVRKTQAHKLGEVLSRHSTHLLLMTATPHKGDPDNYRLLISLVDPEWAEASHHAQDANPVVLRRTKEEMVKPNGEPLYPERVVQTLPYSVSAREGELFEQIYKFINKRYRKAKSANQQSAAFALVTLERRLASSPYAMRESLIRMRAGVEDRLQGSHIARMRILSQESGYEDWAEWEELAESDRWKLEAEAERSATDLIDTRQLKVELQQLDRLIDDVATIIEQGQQEKIVQLRKACDLWIGERNEQAIIFTEFKDTLDYLRECLHDWGYSTTQIHGGMNLKDRRDAEKTFWHGEAQVLVATEAAGEGINLQCCRVMINFDIPWNPCRLEQRMGRIHRYGQQANQVFIFNLVATNTMEGDVKHALLNKLDQMKADLGDKVFDVVGSVLWSQDLRQVLEQIALGDTSAVRQAKQLIDEAGERAKEAIYAEQHIAVTSAPLDVIEFRRKQSAFRAHRLSPEASEKFFRQAVPFVGGAFTEFEVEVSEGLERPAFQVTVPPDLRKRRPRKLTVSFWADACTDDETEDDGVFFISPGHWFFEALINRVVELCTPDLNRGAVYFDLQPESDRPYLIWFAQSHIRNGHDRRAGDLLAAVRHRADEERVVPLSTEILDGFDLGQGKVVDTALRQVVPMLEAQSEVIDQCVQALFVPKVSEQQQSQQDAIKRDWDFLSTGLTSLAQNLNDAAFDAYGEGDTAKGETLISQSEAAQQRLEELETQMVLSGNLLMVAPEVLGVAMVIPAPLEVVVDEPGRTFTVPMRQDREVEDAAMRIVMRHEQRQGRYPEDVSQGNSWDVESKNVEGATLRYIEVKGRGPENANEVLLTEPEWDAARRLGDQHWLYIVRLGDGMMWMIQNPYERLQPKELKRWVLRLTDVARFAETVALDAGTIGDLSGHEDRD